MRVASAPGVVMSTNVTSVGENTLGRNASLPQLGTMGEIERRQLHLILNSPPVTPVRVSVLESLLSTYDLDLKNFLSDGFSLVSSPLGVVPKKTPGEFRIIHHLSYPDGSSVNDFISYEKSMVHYASISDAIAMIKSIGRGSYMSKTDIKSAFCIIPIHPDDYHLLGTKWNNSYFFDRCLPMGCSSSCAIFEAFRASLVWLAKHFLSASGVLHILDDFLFIVESQSKCRSDLSKFLSLCDYLGVPIAHEKTEGPVTTLQFAGITLDTINMEARLPEVKLQKCRELLTDFHKRRKVTLRELQSLTGLLNFTCSVVLPGRAFLRRLFDLTIKACAARIIVYV